MAPGNARAKTNPSARTHPTPKTNGSKKPSLAKPTAPEKYKIGKPDIRKKIKERPEKLEWKGAPPSIWGPSNADLETVQQRGAACRSIREDWERELSASQELVRTKETVIESKWESLLPVPALQGIKASVENLLLEQIKGEKKEEAIDSFINDFRNTQKAESDSSAIALRAILPGKIREALGNTSPKFVDLLASLYPCHEWYTTDRLIPMMDGFLRNIEAEDDMATQGSFIQLRDACFHLTEINQAYGLPPLDSQLPLQLFGDLADTGRQELKQKLRAFLKRKGYNPLVEPGRELNNVREGTPEAEQGTLMATEQIVALSIEQDQQEPAVGKDQPEPAAQQSGVFARVRGDPEASRRIGSSDFNIETCSIEQAKELAGCTWDLDVEVGAFDPESGWSPLGFVVWARPVGFGCRVIVNAGTITHPLYETHPGSAIVQGFSKRLKDDDLGCIRAAASTQLHRGLKEGDVQSIRNYVQVKQSNPQKRKNSPVRYFLVKLKSVSHTMWLTASELKQIVGAAAFDRKWWPQVKREKDRVQKFADRFKELRLHPDTGLKLTPEDKRDSPWLFPDDDLTEPAAYDDASDMELDTGENKETNEENAEAGEGKSDSGGASSSGTTGGQEGQKDNTVTQAQPKEGQNGEVGGGKGDGGEASSSGKMGGQEAQKREPATKKEDSQ